ncbi:Probable LRR receptor-like serine/threonine-protein kinase At3g47570 [Linum grandiflorum]
MNELRGRLPSQLGLLLKLQVLNLGRNLLSGPIPGSISNISSLLELHLSTNYLSGFIPGELGLLRCLKVLDLTINVLTGTVPSSIYNMSSLTYLALASNQLWGEIPRNVGETLPNLLVFRFCFNSFTGGIPSSLHNLTNIRIIRMAHNLLQGDLSKDLTLLYMGDNRIHGSIPSSIARLHGLTLLNISYSDITGEIPDEIGQLENLQGLILAGNKIRGRIPDSFGKLLNLSIADLSRNELVGRIPSSFGNFHSLISLDLSSNRFNGSIPNEILSLPSLSIALNLSHNYLTGELNEDIGLLHNIATIDLSTNFLSGNIPSSIRNCKGLVRLYLARNSFSGSIPSNVKELRGLEVLDLSYNNLSGVIPPELLHLQSLQFLDLSFNNLMEDSCSDEAPLNHSHIRFEGNSKLSLSKACKNGGSNHKTLMTVYVSVAALATLTVCSYLFIWFYLRKNVTKSTQNLGADEYQLVSFDELRQATENFSSENLLGSGGFGTVYRGKLSDNSVVAIKAFNVKRTGSWDSFMAECKALSKVRHRNIVKLITTCSSLDSKNEEFWALVYEFLPNGSLADWLVANKDGGKRDELTLLHRLNIAIDVASALDYLHHGCDVPVVHCDLKPSNILLDQDMTAKVGDFGLAKLLLNPMGDHEAPISSAHFIKGSIGYIPPANTLSAEYGVGSKPSIAGDTYSFGVMLLQLLTGKSPIDESLMESEESLMGWVGSSYPGEVMKVVDPKVYPYVKPEMEEQCIVKILGVGLWCSASSPERRMPMRDALWNLQTARSDLVASYLRRLKR